MTFILKSSYFILICKLYRVNRVKVFIIIFCEQGDYLTTLFVNPWDCKAEVVVTRYSKMTTFSEKGGYMNELRKGWIYFLNRGIIKSVKLPEYGDIRLIIADGVVTMVETKTQQKF